MPPELVPLAAVLALGVGAATFSMGRALLSDPTVRNILTGLFHYPVLIHVIAQIDAVKERTLVGLWDQWG